MLYFVYQVYTQADIVERQIEINDNHIYFIEPKSTYYAPVNEFDKIKISYNKISAIAKDGHRDLYGGYLMSDGDVLQLIAFLEHHAPKIELEVLFEHTKD